MTELTSSQIISNSKLASWQNCPGVVFHGEMSAGECLGQFFCGRTEWLSFGWVNFPGVYFSRGEAVWNVWGNWAEWVSDVVSTSCGYDFSHPG